MIMIQVLVSCNVVLSLGVSEPLMKLITGLELVLRKAQVLNMYNYVCITCTCICTICICTVYVCGYVCICVCVVRIGRVMPVLVCPFPNRSEL